MNLFKALSYKEWIKTRRLIGVLIILTIATLAYAFIEITHNIRFNGAVEEWYGYLYMNFVLPDVTTMLPLLSGLALALVQFIPEMVNKRLKLTLHLPASETSIVSAMLAYGYMILIIIFGLSMIAYAVGLSVIFPMEITEMQLSRLIPAFVAGLSAYGLVSWICFEPGWRQRVLNTFVAVALISVFSVAQYAGAYMHFVLAMAVILIVSFMLPFYSVMRFKHGVI